MIFIQQIAKNKYYSINDKLVVIHGRTIIYDADTTETEKEQFRNYYIKF